MKRLRGFRCVGITLSMWALLSGCESAPKSLPALATGEKISIVDTDDDVLIRIYHAQKGAPAMSKNTVLATLAVNPHSKFHTEAKGALGAAELADREKQSNTVFQHFAEDVSKTPVGTILAIPVAFSVSSFDQSASAFKVCIEGICANPYVIKHGVGAYKLDITVTPEKFLRLSTSPQEAKVLDASFDSMDRQGHAVLYATVDRIGNEARYAPTVYASVFRVALKELPAYGNPTAFGIYRFPNLAHIQIGKNP